MVLSTNCGTMKCNAVLEQWLIKHEAQIEWSTVEVQRIKDEIEFITFNIAGLTQRVGGLWETMERGGARLISVEKGCQFRA